MTENNSKWAASQVTVGAAGNAAPNMKKVDGQVTFIDQSAHKITLKERNGTEHTFIWPPQFVEAMAKLKVYYFTSITAEHAEDVDLWKVVATGYFPRPADWPFQKPAYSGGNYGSGQTSGGTGGYKPKTFTPRNDRIIVLQSTLKAIVEIYCKTHKDGADFNDACDEIILRAVKDTETLLKAAGIE